MAELPDHPPQAIEPTSAVGVHLNPQARVRRPQRSIPHRLSSGSDRGRRRSGRFRFAKRRMSACPTPDGCDRRVSSPAGAADVCPRPHRHRAPHPMKTVRTKCSDTRPVVARARPPAVRLDRAPSEQNAAYRARVVCGRGRNPTLRLSTCSRRPLKPCVGGLQPLSPLHAADAVHAGTSRRRPWPSLAGSGPCGPEPDPAQARRLSPVRTSWRPAALREIGRIECSLFMLDWTTDPGGRVPAQRDDT